jgi:hypothetical protein
MLLESFENNKDELAAQQHGSATDDSLAASTQRSREQELKEGQRAAGKSAQGKW